MEKTGAVIVAAGHKSRGMTFSPMLPVGDSTVIRRIIITMKRVGIDPIVVVTGKQGDELEKHINDLEVISLRNPHYETEQMFDSISMGLTYIRGLCSHMLILPAKFPLLLRDTLEKMLSEQADIIRPVFDGKRGHPVLISDRAAEKVLEYRGDRGLRGALFEEEPFFLTRDIPVDDQGIIFAMETDEDGADEEIEKQKIQVHPEIRLVFRRNDPFFGPLMAHFLTVIHHTGSMQTACRQLHMSYTKGWKLLKEAERQLGCALLVSRSGGAEGGSSRLTKEAEDFLARYLCMEEELRTESERLFRKYFPEEYEGRKENSDYHQR